MKKTMFMLLIFTVAVMAFAGGGKDAGSDKQVDAKPILIRVPMDVALDSTRGIALQMFQKYVEEKSGGRFSIEIFPNGLLGGPQEYLESLMQGSGNIYLTTIGSDLGPRAPLLAAWELPFLFSGLDEMEKVAMSDYGQNINNNLPELLGIRFLGHLPLGVRVIAANKPITGMDSFKGLRMRVSTIEQYIVMAKNLGTTPISMALSELYTALEQGVIDALELPYNLITSNKYYEMLKNVLLSDHVISNTALVVNEKFFQSLTPDLQQVLIDGGKYIQNIIFQLVKDEEAKARDYLAKEGVAFTTPDDNFRKQLVESQRETERVFYRVYPGTEEAVSQFRKIMGK